MRDRRPSAFAIAAAVTVMAFFGVAGHSRFSGPVLLRVTATHGLHRDDLVVVACWLLTMFLCARSWSAGRRAGTKRQQPAPASSRNGPLSNRGRLRARR